LFYLYTYDVYAQEKHDEYSEKEKVSLDDSSFEELEHDFQEV